MHDEQYLLIEFIMFDNLLNLKGLDNGVLLISSGRDTDVDCVIPEDAETCILWKLKDNSIYLCFLETTFLCRSAYNELQ